MTLYEADISFMYPEGMYRTVDALDAEDAEFKIIEDLKEEYPDATMIVVDNIRKVTNH